MSMNMPGLIIRVYDKPGSKNKKKNMAAAKELLKHLEPVIAPFDDEEPGKITDDAEIIFDGEFDVSDELCKEIQSSLYELDGFGFVFHSVLAIQTHEPLNPICEAVVCNGKEVVNINLEYDSEHPVVVVPEKGLPDLTTAQAYWRLKKEIEGRS